jgi:hypothetical protein
MDMTRKRTAILLTLIVTSVVIGLLMLPWTGGGGDLHRLRRPLCRVEIHFDCWGVGVFDGSPWQGKWVGTEEPAFLARVEAWLKELKRPRCDNALKQSGGKIVLTFQDGTQEELLFLGPRRPGPGAGSCNGFSWDGLGVVGGREPFSDFLRELRLE